MSLSRRGFEDFRHLAAFHSQPPVRLDQQHSLARVLLPLGGPQLALVRQAQHFEVFLRN